MHYFRCSTTIDGTPCAVYVHATDIHAAKLYLREALDLEVRSWREAKTSEFLSYEIITARFDRVDAAEGQGRR